MSIMESFYSSCLAGIWGGMHTVRYFDGKTYEWVGISRQPNILGKVRLHFVYFSLFMFQNNSLFYFDV